MRFPNCAAVLVYLLALVCGLAAPSHILVAHAHSDGGGHGHAHAPVAQAAEVLLSTGMVGDGHGHPQHVAGHSAHTHLHPHAHSDAGHGAAPDHAHDRVQHTALAVPAEESRAHTESHRKGHSLPHDHPNDGGHDHELVSLRVEANRISAPAPAYACSRVLDALPQPMAPHRAPLIRTALGPPDPGFPYLQYRRGPPRV